MKLTLTAFDLAQRFVGVKEAPGLSSNPQVSAMLSLDASEPLADSVPWCSAFVNYICWLLRLPRSKSLAARSWLKVGTPIDLEDALAGFDVVVFNRANGPTSPDVAGPGHVGFYAHHDNDLVTVLGGNQADSVSLARFKRSDVLGIRRLA